MLLCSTFTVSLSHMFANIVSQVRTAVMERAKSVPELDIAITKNHFNYFPDDAAREEHKQ